MYKDRIKRILRSSLLIGVIIIILFSMALYFVIGPLAVDKAYDQELLEKVEEKYKLSGCSLFNRFSDDKTYFIAKCVAHYIVYSEDGIVLTKEIVKEFDSNKIDIDISDFEINIGYYQDKLVYVVKNEKREILFDYNSYEILRDYSLKG